MQAKADTSYFVYKYDYHFVGTTTRSLEYSSETENNDKIKRYPYHSGIGFRFEFEEGGHISGDSGGSQSEWTNAHRMYMSYDLDINAGQNSVVTNAGYYHNTSKAKSAVITNITANGPTFLFLSDIGLDAANPTLYLNATNY